MALAALRSTAGPVAARRELTSCVPLAGTSSLTLNRQPLPYILDQSDPDGTLITAGPLGLDGSRV